MRISLSRRSAAGVGGLLMALVVSACTVVVDEGPPPRPGPGPGPGPFCTREYAPVCGRNGPDRQTFANACLADAAGYRIIHPGQCRRERPEPEPRFCTREYAPVCARRGPVVRTFGNACEADVADFRVLYPGPCR